MLKKDYYIGLKIRSNAIGWSVTDESFKLLKFKKRNMWGVRLFSEGSTAEERRMNRSGRRRLNRRKQRMILLKSLIGKMVVKEDPLFFMRLENGYQSSLKKGYDYNLFNEEDFDDKTYYKKYPTIYHLRQDLCESKEKKDPRLIYLAIHHILKYRGNFLYENQDFTISNNQNIKKGLKELIEYIASLYGSEIEVAFEKVDLIMEVLENNSKKRKNKITEIKELLKEYDLNSELNKAYDELLKLILRMSCNISTVFNTVILDENEKAYKISFEDDLEMKRDFIESQLQDNYYYFTKAEEIASHLVLNMIIQGEESISKSMIKKYENHKKELRELKRLFKEYLPKYYKEMFKSDKKNNYVQYISHPKDNPKQDFYKYLISLLDLIKDERANKTIEDIKEKIELNCFLDKQRQKENSVIPYQLHLKELEAILSNQEAYYSDIKENKEKIISLMTFRIPYYVGPLNDKSKFSWIVRKNQNPIFPWTFEEEVDVLETAENFIKSMTNMCTYLPEEPVLPKNSILYSKFMVLNELNKVRVDGRLIKHKFKVKIIEELFMKKNIVKHSDLIKFYHANGEINAKIVEGTQKDDSFASSLQAVRFFKNIYKERFNDCIDEIEKMIEWSTIYEDTEIFKKRVQTEFPHLDQKTVNKIVKKRFKGWGRLSRKLLEDLRGYNKYGEPISIMDVLYKEKKNLMQIINDKSYGFKEAIEKANKIDLEDNIDYEFIKNIPCSPKNKKAIWQAIKVVDEIVDIIGCEPKQINIEFVREEKQKIRSFSRIKMLTDLYNKIKQNLDDDEIQVYEKLKKEKDSNRMRSEKLYLYYLQLGKCMYSGDVLYLDQLANYEIVKILPMSLINDNSLENKVLVKKGQNSFKENHLVLPENVIDRQRVFWKKLLDAKMITSKKYFNLIRKNFTPNDEMTFINKQLIETSQIVKQVTNIFTNKYTNSTVVAIRAELSNDFKEKHSLYIMEEINDYHYAQNAYITSVIGTFITRKYPELKKEFVYNDYSSIRKDINRVNGDSFKAKEGFIVSQMNDEVCFANGDIVWEGINSILLVREICEYKDCYISRKVSEKKGKLFNVSIIGADKIAQVDDKKIHKVIPINSDRKEVERYGGFRGLNFAYGVAVEYKVKNKLKREVKCMPILYANASEEAKMVFIRKETSDNVKIIKDKILLDNLIEIKGQKLYMASHQNFNNATQLLLSKESKKVLYRMLNYKMNYDIKQPTNEEYLSLFDEIINKAILYYPFYEKGIEKIKSSKELFESAEFESSKGYVGKDDFIKSVLKALKADKANCDIVIGNKRLCNLGRIQISNFDLDNAYFISQSVTGMYERKYKL